MNKAAINYLSVAFLYERGFSFHLNKYLGVGLLGCMISMVRLSKKLLSCFPKRLYHFAFSSAIHESFIQFLYVLVST